MKWKDWRAICFEPASELDHRRSETTKMLFFSDRAIPLHELQVWKLRVIFQRGWHFHENKNTTKILGKILDKSYKPICSMVLVYLPTKLGDFFRPNVGVHSAASRPRAGIDWFRLRCSQCVIVIRSKNIRKFTLLQMFQMINHLVRWKKTLEYPYVASDVLVVSDSFVSVQV